MALEVVYIEPPMGFEPCRFSVVEVDKGIGKVEEFVAVMLAESSDWVRDHELEATVGMMMWGRCCGKILALTSRSTGLSKVFALHEH